jgi:hypothetical protein
VILVGLTPTYEISPLWFKRVSNVELDGTTIVGLVLTVFGNTKEGSNLPNIKFQD